MSCAACGMGDHRYGTTDTRRKFDAMGCVNAVLPRLWDAEKVLRQIASADYRGSMPEATRLALGYFASQIDPAAPAGTQEETSQ